MKKHCSYIGRDCPSTPECGEHECQAAQAFPFGDVNEEMATAPLARPAFLARPTLSRVPGDAAAVRTLVALGYTYRSGEQWVPPLGPAPKLGNEWGVGPLCLTTAPAPARPYVVAAVIPDPEVVLEGLRRAWALAKNIGVPPGSARPAIDNDNQSTPADSVYDKAAFEHVLMWLERRDSMDRRVAAKKVPT